MRSRLKILVTHSLLGSFAAWLQSILGNVSSHGVFAFLQSAAMRGYGFAIVNRIIRALGVIWAAAVTAYSALGRRP